MKAEKIFLFISLSLFFFSCSDDDVVNLDLSSVKIGNYNLDLNNFENNLAAPTTEPIIASFSAPLDVSSTAQHIQLVTELSGEVVPLTVTFLDNNKTFSASPTSELMGGEKYKLTLSAEMRGANGEVFPGISISFTTSAATLDIISLNLGGQDGLQPGQITDVSCEGIFEITFSKPLNPSTATIENIILSGNGGTVSATIGLSEENKKVTLSSTQKLRDLIRYQLLITNKVKGSNNENVQQTTKSFYTAVDPTPDFPVISDDALLTLGTTTDFQIFLGFRTSGKWYGQGKKYVRRHRYEWRIRFWYYGYYRGNRKKLYFPNSRRGAIAKNCFLPRGGGPVSWRVVSLDGWKFWQGGAVQLKG